MEIKRIIVHEIKKEQGVNITTVNLSESLLPIDSNSTELIYELLKSYQGDKILYAVFDDSPGKYFAEKFETYRVSDKSDSKFIRFSKNVTGNLESIIKSKILSKGGYVVYSEYVYNANKFVGIFLIRDTEGKLLERKSNTFEIQKIDYLDTSHLAMACRINEEKIQGGESNYLSFTRYKQQEVSEYFTDWICVKQLESSTEFTESLYKIINGLPSPINIETGTHYTIDEIRAMVYGIAQSNSQKNVNLLSIGEQIYGSSNILVEYAEANNISIDTEFRYDKKVMKKFVQINIVKDGISLKFSRGEPNTKVRISEENPNMVIIESAIFANELRIQMEQDG